MNDRSGVLVIDKPLGVTSFDVVAQVRHARRARKTGHSGTLDPMATGVLVVCLEEATKLVPFLMEGEKVYRAEVLFGIETDTQDADGHVTARRDASALRQERVAAELATFVGRIRQVPPMYSALKHHGRPLHELARAGLEVAREAREIEIYSAELDAFDEATARATVRVACSKGTYVRTLAADLGARLGVGAHLVGLRRLRTGPFTLEDAISLEDAPLAVLISPSRALSFLPAVEVSSDAAERLRAGGLLPRNLDRPPGRFRVVGPGDDLVAVAEADSSGTRVLRVLHA